MFYIYVRVFFIWYDDDDVSWLRLSTSRISVIFRIRSAKTVIITDASLLKRLALLCGFVGVALLVRTLVAPPVVIVGRTADNLKAFLCKTDYWDHTFTSSKFRFSYVTKNLVYLHTYSCINIFLFISSFLYENILKFQIISFFLSFLFVFFYSITVEVLFLAWGVRLCIMVRKAPSEFNESRFISMAIYNEFLLTCFLNVSM